jgi:hypothetical protein
MPNDTIYIIKDTLYVAQRQVDSLDVLDKVNNFYSSSMTILLTVGGIFVTVFGVVLPFLQRRSLRIQEEKLKERFESLLASYKSEVSKEARETIDHKLKTYLDKLDLFKSGLEIKQNNERISIEGRLYHLEGYFQQEFKKYTWAISSFMRCIDSYLSVNDTNNIGVVLDNISECLDKVNFTELNEIKNFRNYSLNDFLSKFDLNNSKLEYARNLRQVKVKVEMIEKGLETENKRITN